ncbi:MAG: SDR family oxidoreductase [Oscillatoria sp. PMC 1051.18]|nr:SDR family oxidoreductase [Oscillatoria sp. PMC 1050.18]MEC5029656.1 SDR family oxidoreductase [Oscillatoria sp. PMC 1051.18]
MKVALITGGTRGIGLAIARRLAQNNYNLVLGYRSNHDAAEKAKQELEKLNIQVVTVAGDIKQPETVDNLFQVIENNFHNQLTSLVCLAGYLINGKIPGEFTFEQYDEAQELYPKSFLRCMEKALACMQDNEGRVVVISSRGVHNPGKFYGMLAPAKGAMEVLAKHYALAVAPRGITVNIVAPGYIRTEEWEQAFKAFPYLEEMPPNVTPMGRWGQPDDVAALVSFLCSQESGFLTGQHIYIDGGVGLSLFWNIHRFQSSQQELE